MTAPTGLERRLLLFREAFDQSFAAAPNATVETFEDLLAIRIAGSAYALRVREISGLAVSRKIVPLPSRRPELLGVAGIRGSLVPVYSLGALLGHGVHSKLAPWLALAGASDLLALGFEEFEGFVRVSSRDVHAQQSGDGAIAHVREVVRVGKQSLRVVDVRSTLGALDVHSGAAGSTKGS